MATKFRLKSFDRRCLCYSESKLKRSIDGAEYCRSDGAHAFETDVGEHLCSPFTFLEAQQKALTSNIIVAGASFKSQMLRVVLSYFNIKKKQFQSPSLLTRSAC